jgi:RHS repeat-associated protein
VVNKEWFVYDGLGSCRAMVKPNAQGTEAVIVARYDYDVYGAVRTQSGSSANKFKYVASIGHPTDEETGLIYMRARYYEPGTGRFVSEDPAFNGMNWYSYVDANPVIAYDPTGNSKYIDLGGGWWIRIDDWYLESGTGNLVRDAHWGRGDVELGSIRSDGILKHGNTMPNKRVSKALRKLGWVIGLTTLDTYFQQDPLDFISILLDIAGEHELAAQLDAINRNLLG